jgi:trans-AT polyketide synthase/acyltransferase/oxidoreductase domain-containing protein
MALERQYAVFMDEQVSPAGAIAPRMLGDAQFRADYNVRHAYIAGAMFKGISSAQMVAAMGREGLLCYFGTGGLRRAQVEEGLARIQSDLSRGEPYGMNLLCNMDHPEREEQVVDLFLQRGVSCVEAAAFMQITPALVRFRLHGLSSDPAGNIRATTRILAKVSRPEVAAAFMSPAPESIVRNLRERNLVSEAAAQLSAHVPMAEDVCVEADSGGHTDQGVAIVMMPVMFRLRDEAMRRYRFMKRIRVGAAGGIGTPEAAAAAFVMGADFILTGSINQCTVESGASEAVKDMLQNVRIQDTEYVPAGDMFEIGAKCQVVRRGSLFPARANKLYDLYQRHGSLEEIDAQTRQQIQERYFKRSFAEVWQETREYYQRAYPQMLREIEGNPKRVMGLIFKWYFVHTVRLALRGRPEDRVDFQVHSGPAMGALNDWLRGTELESWRNRHVVTLANEIMTGTAQFLSRRIGSLVGAP